MEEKYEGEWQEVVRDTAYQGDNVEGETVTRRLKAETRVKNDPEQVAKCEEEEDEGQRDDFHLEIIAVFCVILQQGEIVGAQFQNQHDYDEGEGDEKCYEENFQ